MKTKVLITIKGMQHEYEDVSGSGIQTMQQGIYRHVLDKHIITYEEPFSGSDISSNDSVKNILKIGKDSVSLIKRGQTCVDMVFKEGYYHTGMYETPFGTMQAGFITSCLLIKETEDSIDVQINYGLELNYSHVSDCTVYINICSVRRM